MHGRLKVRTTEEQEERKRLEREKKLKLYKYAMNECLKRIKEKQYDEESLKISAELLVSNADILTLWNFRKNILQSFTNDNQRSKDPQQKDEEITPTMDDQKLADHFVNELNVTEICLKKNPKSYGSWFHRQWCLVEVNSPVNDHLSKLSKQFNWKNELELCNFFLNADERNFHCWKHRSFVINAGNLSKFDELDFTYEKICTNFSNYSAWHYRSKLIETLFTDNQIGLDIFEKELKVVENALFTDPNDQSAWIYEKWLLNEYKKALNNSHLEEKVIEGHLKNILDLSALEDDKSKWCLLTAIELMTIIDANKYKEKISKYINQLQLIDPKRKVFYIDLSKKIQF
jgi:geranylgeranyl transferase type-2 subunit alpha